MGARLWLAIFKNQLERVSVRFESQGDRPFSGGPNRGLTASG